MVAHALIPITIEAEVGGSGVLSIPVSLSDILCPKQTTQERKDERQTSLEC